MKNLINIGYLKNEDYLMMVMTLNEINDMGVPFHFEQCECFICKGKKNIYIENIKGDKISLNYHDKFHEWYLESYVVLEKLKFEGFYDEFIELFKKKSNKFSPNDLELLEKTITINGDSIEKLGLTELFEERKKFFDLSDCESCGGVVIEKEKYCKFCNTLKNKNKKITLWQREMKKRKE
jgi:hypothetical protein